MKWSLCEGKSVALIMAAGRACFDRGFYSFYKGLATRTEEGGAFRYKPAITQTELRAAAVNNVLAVVFEGDLDAFKAAAAAAKPGKRK
jgi:hypothetical protein